MKSHQTSDVEYRLVLIFKLYPTGIIRFHEDKSYIFCSEKIKVRVDLVFEHFQWVSSVATETTEKSDDTIHTRQLTHSIEAITVAPLTL